MDSSDAYLRDLVRFKRYAFSVAQLAEQHREILAAFVPPDSGAVPQGDVEVHFRNFVSRHTRLVDALARAKESVNGAFDIYVSRVAHHTNQVMRLLTVVSTVLFPLTVILGFFGASNLDAVPALTGKEGFIAMIMSCLLVFVVILAIFRRRGWL
jgi:magnesium transporter